MEVMTPLPPMDFNFESVSSTPFSSAPSSPKLFREAYFSAPTSPSSSASIYRDMSFTERTCNSAVTDTYYRDEDDQNFSFEFSGKLERPTLAADELFDQGRIRPLEPPIKSSVFSPKTPKQKQLKQNKANPITKITKEGQGSKRVCEVSSKPIHRSTKSLSEFVYEEEEQSAVSSSSKSTSYYFFTNWKLKDLILFRSASEGRADERDSLKKYTALNKKQQEVRNPSFRSTDGSSSASGLGRRRPVSALEFHYKPNKAVQSELKRKTYLPYTTGLMGCAKFNPTVDGLVKGLNLAPK